MLFRTIVAVFKIAVRPVGLAVYAHTAVPPAATVRFLLAYVHPVQPVMVTAERSSNKSVSETTRPSSGLGLTTVIEPAMAKVSSVTCSSTVMVQVKGTVSPANPDCERGSTVFTTVHSWRSSYVPAAVLLML